MLPFRLIAGFFCRLLVIYALLAIPWPGIKAGYAAIFRAGGNLIFGSLVSGGSVHFHPMLEPQDKFDTHIHFVNLRSGEKKKLLTSSRNPGYLQTAFLVSLVLATPVPWRRRLWALLWGLIPLNMAIAGRLLVRVLYMFSSARLSLLAPGPPWENVLQRANDFAAGDVVMMLMLPVFIWILVSFRRDDFRMMLDRTRLGLRSVKNARPTALLPR